MHAARTPGVVMTWWCGVVVVWLAGAGAAPRLPPAHAPPPGHGEHSYQMSRKSCVAGGARGSCMWVQECNRAGGAHAGVCVDGFMFGSCCLLPERAPATEAVRPAPEPVPHAFMEHHRPVTVTASPYVAPPSSTTPHHAPPRPPPAPWSHTQRPAFMTKPIDGAPSHSYRPPDLNLPLYGQQNSDVVNKVNFNVNKHDESDADADADASPGNKISSSPSLGGGGQRGTARPLPAAPSNDSEADNTIASAEWMSRPSLNMNTIHWQATTEPGFITKPRPGWDKPSPGKPKPTKKFATTTAKPATNKPTKPPYHKPVKELNKTHELTTHAPIRTTAATNTVECGVTSMFPRPETRIVGGSDASFGRWPWQVSVRRTSFFGFSSTHRCGGAIINEGWIATAGHCVDDLLTAQIRIRVGEYDFSSVAEKYPFVERSVSSKAVHPKYNFYTYEYDLALVKLESPLTFAPHIAPICLPASDDLLIGENATVTGWGRLSEGGTLPSVLQEVQVPIVSNERCKSMFLRAGRHEFIPDIFLCAGHEKGGHDSCQGDSGGPLQVRGRDQRYFLAGIISWGIGCAEANLPGVCTRISKFVPWILQTVT